MPGDVSAAPSGEQAAGAQVGVGDPVHSPGHEPLAVAHPLPGTIPAPACQRQDHELPAVRQLHHDAVAGLKPQLGQPGRGGAGPVEQLGLGQPQWLHAGDPGPAPVAFSMEAWYGLQATPRPMSSVWIPVAPPKHRRIPEAGKPASLRPACIAG